MRTTTMALTLMFAFGLSGIFGVSAQDLLPTPEGRLGGQVPLPSPGPDVPTPVPLIPTPIPALIPSPTPTGEPSPTMRPQLPNDGAAANLQIVGAAVVTVRVWHDGRVEAGSGWAINVARIVTVVDLVDDAERVEVVSSDGPTWDATVVASDRRSGIAILDVPTAEFTPPKQGGIVRSGDRVTAFGLPDASRAPTMVSGTVVVGPGLGPGHQDEGESIVVAMSVPREIVGGPLVDTATGAIVGMVVTANDAKTVSGETASPELEDAEMNALPERDLTFAVPIEVVQRIVDDVVADQR